MMLRDIFKNTARFCLFLYLTSTASAQAPWTGLQRLAGVWQVEGRFEFEKWETESPDALRGEGYRQPPGGEKQLTETLRLVRNADGGIAYEATVPGQNDGGTTAFALTFFTPKSWTFENPEHDFPQKIEYRFLDTAYLQVTVGGGAGQDFTLRLRKMPEMQQPKSLAGYDVFVSSRNSGTIKRFNAFTGEYRGEFGHDELLGETQDVAIGPDGMLYATSLQRSQILKFDPATGTFLGPFSSGYELSKPTKMTFGPDGFVYVSQWGDGQTAVVRFDARTGVFDRAFTGNLPAPLGHAWDTSGNLYVACFSSKDIRKFDRDGQLLGVVSPPGDLKGPSNLWFDGSGNLFVADWEEGRIKRFRPDGAGFVFDSLFAEGFARLEGVAIGPDGYLYACDWQLNLVKKLDAATGSQIGVYLETGGMQHPNALVFWRK